MGRYIIKRLLMMIPVLICVSFVVYFLMDLAPGDLVSAMAPPDATPEEIEQMKEDLGLNGTVFDRYFRYLKGLVRLNLGQSLSQKRPVADIFFERLPRTMELAFGSIFVALLIAIPLGIAAATHHRTWLDGVSMTTSMIGVSMPNFWFGLLLIIAFSLQHKWFPSYGADQGLKSLVLPALTLGTEQAGTLTRITRSSMTFPPYFE